MMSDSQRNRRLFTDRMTAVRHVLEENNLPTKALTDAFDIAGEVFEALAADAKKLAGEVTITQTIQIEHGSQLDGDVVQRILKAIANERSV